MHAKAGAVSGMRMKSGYVPVAKEMDLMKQTESGLCMQKACAVSGHMLKSGYIPVAKKMDLVKQTESGLCMQKPMQCWHDAEKRVCTTY